MNYLFLEAKMILRDELNLQNGMHCDVGRSPEKCQNALQPFYLPKKNKRRSYGINGFKSNLTLRQTCDNNSDKNKV